MSLARLRRCRLGVALLMASSPAAGGSLLPALHPCPVDAPWTADAGPDGPIEHSGRSQHRGQASGGASHAHHSGSQHCTCIGRSEPGAARPAAEPPTEFLAAAPITTTALAASPDASLILEPHAALLPPKTAPPLS
jgi:hypothetical protein